VNHLSEKRMIEGRQSVLEALRSGVAVSKVLLQKGTGGRPVEEVLNLARQNSVPVTWLDKDAFSHRSVSRNHQGVMAEAAPFRYAGFHDLLSGRVGEKPFLLVLDHIQDPHNLGALLRSAYAAGCHGVVIPERRAAQVTPAVEKAAAGSAALIPVARVVNITRCLEECKEAGLWVYGADMAGESLYTEADYRGGTALVIGGEGDGLSRLVREKCDSLVRLPMKGRLASLNASVAGALLLYEVYRQRDGLVSKVLDASRNGKI
jgi:23S rRNA (guanosine2251-2'-O)-methyltransferase